MSLFNELKRRNVFKVSIAYVVLAWLVMQVADVILNNIEAPGWVFHVVLLFLALGLPFAVFFAWAFELTPDGLKREHEIDRSQSIASETGRKLNFTITAILVLALGYFAYDKFVVSASRETAAIEQAVEEATSKAILEPADSKADAGETDKSIAVLPFVNMSSDKEQEYFSDGLSEELLNLLAKIPDLKVASRSSAFSYKGKDFKIEDVGRELNVAHVLEGSVRKSGNQVRITAQLIKTEDGFHLWSETWDRSLDNIFAIQDEISAAVVKELKVKLMGGAPEVAETNPEAYALVLQARHLELQKSAESLESAERLLKQALEIAPEYATGWSGLARVYSEQFAGGNLSIKEAYGMAIDAANRGIQIDPKHAPSYAAIGSIALLSNDPEDAALNLQKALQLDPANPYILSEAAVLVELLGRLDEAIEVLKFVVARDPVNAEGHAGLGRSYRVSSRWDEAIKAYRTSLALSPDRWGSYHGIGEAFLFKGDFEQAMENYALEPDLEWRAKGTIMALHRLGRIEEFDTGFEDFKNRWGEQWPSEVAHVYAWIGNNDAAFEWLDKAVIQNEEGLNQQYYQPLLRSLHDDPRWAEFRERTIGSEEQLSAIVFEVNIPH